MPTPVVTTVSQRVSTIMAVDTTKTLQSTTSEATATTLTSELILALGLTMCLLSTIILVVWNITVKRYIPCALITLVQWHTVQQWMLLVWYFTDCCILTRQAQPLWPNEIPWTIMTVGNVNATTLHAFHDVCIIQESQFCTWNGPGNRAKLIT